MKSAFVLLLTSGTVACTPTLRVDAASKRTFAESIPICALLANPKPFVGKVVNVSGYLFSTPEGFVFSGDSCDRGEIPLSRDNYSADNKLARAALDAAWRAHRRANVPVVMSGILKDNFHGDTFGCMMTGGGICQRYSLQSDSLVAARPPTTKAGR